MQLQCPLNATSRSADCEMGGECQAGNINVLVGVGVAWRSRQNSPSYSIEQSNQNFNTRKECANERAERGICRDLRHSTDQEVVRDQGRARESVARRIGARSDGPLKGLQSRAVNSFGRFTIWISSGIDASCWPLSTSLQSFATCPVESILSGGQFGANRFYASQQGQTAQNHLHFEWKRVLRHCFRGRILSTTWNDPSDSVHETQKLPFAVSSKMKSQTRERERKSFLKSHVRWRWTEVSWIFMNRVKCRSVSIELKQIRRF